VLISECPSQKTHPEQGSPTDDPGHCAASRIGSVWFSKAEGRCSGVRSDNPAKTNGDPGAIRTRDSQLRRSTLEILYSLTNSNSYNTFQVGLVAAEDRLSRLGGSIGGASSGTSL